ncbi:phage tail protein [Ralstonia syzygii subsp. celebesensis]|uniref:Phage tail protein n=2 Tax=Ralstonia syzygii subsp. celebesensis TaxID=1310168 RepID=A0A1U9VJ50_9RALS|nr:MULTISPECIES: phage tail protein [Ralstonia solanacearum species complex]AQW30505.1 phage tail protein [blood disease bacterium A2-HR MARDI]QQV55665.1 phage tail protein [Ralstonia syzygii subsp. celebesensis]CCA81099.1 putative tail sheath protein (gpL) from Mu-like prophage FluMu [blood disease bacterium R229]
MTITFSDVPQALRYPGAYIEIDGSQAGLGDDLPVVLLVGQKLDAGTAPAGELVRVTSTEDAKTKAGAGSMLAQMAARYRKVDQTFDLYMLPYADNAAGVAATGSINVTSVATSSGTLALYIAQRTISVGIAAGETAAQTATAIAQAVTDAGADIPVTAAAAGAVVTLTARHRGTCGNDIDVRLNLYGEEAPAGLALALTAMAGGTGNPLPGDLTALIGQKWFRYIALGINDAATLAAWHAESQRRYKPPVQAGFRVFATHRGDYADAAAFGETKNYEHITDLSLGINPPTTWEAAATLAAAAAPKLYNNPVISLEGTSLPGMVATSYHDWTNANSLLFKGVSVMEVGTDGSCYIKRLISMYQHRSDGSTDDAYLDINVAEVMERIRYAQRMGAIKKFRGTVAAKTDEGYRPGLPITTEDGVKAFLLSLYQNVLMAQYGWVQAYSYYKSTLVVEQDPDNPSRFNFLDDPVVNSPFYILAGRSRFRKAVPVV